MFPICNSDCVAQITILGILGTRMEKTSHLRELAPSQSILHLAKAEWMGKTLRLGQCHLRMPWLN